jgi:hypothetical protein
MKKGKALPPTWAAHQSGFRCYQGQIGYGGRHQQLVERLFPAKVAGFARPKLHQSGNSMFYHLPKGAIGRIGRTALKRSGLLKQGLLRMQRYGASFARFALYTRGAQETGFADRFVELEHLQSSSFPPAILAPAASHQSPGHPTGWALTGHGFWLCHVYDQIDGEVLSGEMPLVGSFRYPGHQLAPCIGERLAGGSIAVATVTDTVVISHSIPYCGNVPAPASGLTSIGHAFNVTGTHSSNRPACSARARPDLHRHRAMH